MFCFKKTYFTFFVLLFGIEVLIAAFVHDNFIRPSVGDFLVVILLYCFVRTFVKAPALPVAISVLSFSFLIEGLQYLNIVHYLHLEHWKLAVIVIGTSFEWSDLLAYTLGIATVLGIEKLTGNKPF